MADENDIVGRLRLAAKPEQIASVWGLTVVRCSLLHDAADEIERLRAQVEDLLPFAVADAKSGASIGPSIVDDDCSDAQWYESSLRLLCRVEAGEFAQ